MPKAARNLSEIRLSRLTRDPSLKALFASIERDDPLAPAESAPQPRQPSPLAARELVGCKMPLDTTGAPAPRPLSQWVDHLKRTRLTAKKARRVQRQRRAATQKRLTEAERLIAQIIDGADVIAQGAAPDGGYPAVYLLLTLHTAYFNDLAIFGSELEDAEDGGDREPSEDREHDLGWPERVAQAMGQFGTEDGEPSLGSLGMADQRRWHDGNAGDLEQEIGPDNREYDPAEQGEPEPDYPSYGLTPRKGGGQ